MRLIDYLAATGATFATLAPKLSKRLGRAISPGTLRAIAGGGGTRSDLALALIEHSKEYPTPDGGTITLPDLVRQTSSAA